MGDQIPTRRAKKSGMGGNSPPQLKGPQLQRKMAENQQRRQQALTMRIQGGTYEQIAGQMGVSTMTAYRYVQDAIREIPKEEAKHAKTLEISKLNASELRINARLAKPCTVIEAVRLELALVKIGERRAKLEGFDAPTRAELTGRNGAPLTLTINDLQSMSNAELERVINASLRGRTLGRGNVGAESADGDSESGARQPH